MSPSVLRAQRGVFVKALTSVLLTSVDANLADEVNGLSEFRLNQEVLISLTQSSTFYALNRHLLGV